MVPLPQATNCSLLCAVICRIRTAAYTPTNRVDCLHHNPSVPGTLEPVIDISADFTEFEFCSLDLAEILRAAMVGPPEQVSAGEGLDLQPNPIFQTSKR